MMCRWLVVCLGASLASGGTLGLGEGLIQNPGFEQIEPDTAFPAAWEPMHWSNPRGTIESADTGRTGARSVVLRGIPDRQTTARGGGNNHLVAQEIALSGMRRLTLKLYARTEGDGLAYLSMMTRDTEGNRLQYATTRRYAGLDDWEEIVWSFTTDPKTATLQILLRNGGSGSVYYDDVTLTSPEDVLDSGTLTAIVDSLVGGRISSLTAFEGQRAITPWRGVFRGGLMGLLLPGDAGPNVLRDMPWDLEVIEPNRRLTLRCNLVEGDWAGLAFEKTLSVEKGSATVRCDVTVRNQGDRALTLDLRTQDCLHADHTVMTWPTEQGPRVYRPPTQPVEHGAWMDSLAGQWIAATDAAGNGLVLRFDEKLVQKGHVYSTPELHMLELRYRPVQIAAGEAWEMGYSLTAVSAADGAAPRGGAMPDDVHDAGILPELPQPAREIARYPALEGIYPYGEYHRGYTKELGPAEQYRADQLDIYRRSFFNTWLVAENLVLGQYAQTGKSDIVEELRRRNMRLFLRGEHLRVFERSDEGGIARETYPGDYTREAAVERIESGGLDLPTRRRFAEEYRDAILAYDVSDEPGPEHIHNYMGLQRLFQEIDPHHPALTILNFSRTEFLPYMPVYYGDEYPIRRTSRNPWMVMDVVQAASQRTPGPVWLMAQAFGGLPEYTWQLPTEPEMRLMLWGAIAGGCQGITFHGSFSPPNWRVNAHYFTTAIDSFGAAAPCWDAIVDVGRVITAIGPSMLQCKVDPAEALRAECPQLEDHHGHYTGPAVRLGILKRPAATGGRFVVAVNQDLDRTQEARLMAEVELIGDDAVLVDLHEALEGAPADVELVSARAGHRLALEPGHGRIFFCGTRGQAAEVVGAVRAAHADNLLQIFRLDAQIARANGVDVAGAEAMAEQGNLPEAFARLAAADGMGVLRRRIEELDEVVRLLTPVAHTFREHWDVVVPPEDREAVGRYDIWRNTRDPRMQQYADEVAEAFTDRIRLLRRVHRGEAALVEAQIAALTGRARRLNKEATAYVRTRVE